MGHRIHEAGVALLVLLHGALVPQLVDGAVVDLAEVPAQDGRAWRYAAVHGVAEARWAECLLVVVAGGLVGVEVDPAGEPAVRGHEGDAEAVARLVLLPATGPASQPGHGNPTRSALRPSGIISEETLFSWNFITMVEFLFLVPERHKNALLIFRTLLSTSSRLLTKTTKTKKHIQIQKGLLGILAACG